MNTKQNLHTHTVYCDGKNTPAEVIQTAIAKGFGSLGFSMHCDPLLDGRNPDFPEKFEAYKKEILHLKTDWRGKFPIFLGIEYDVYADWYDTVSCCDYMIGSVHYLKGNGSYIKMDLRSADMVRECIDVHFGGDFLKFAASYYESLSELPKYGSFDIIGHFDLLTKHIGSFPEWDVNCDGYRKLVDGAIDSLRGKIPLFEVNTGAIPRGYRNEPYPDRYILKKLRENGFGAVISTDCHNAEHLDCYVEESKALLRELGFASRFILTENGFAEVGL